ncbi:T6SS immunity protein Tdi1 domain-containing protein [uncultured Maribacter sp.]|uniref:T6SS immunity protein Tdi1 domain-containing protein n=1 Tax=uncultured Maribacter sp. TaxID=431308 RepID=UPI0026372DB9|nr:T6SS immunity protein Tdi1 domain-containing protein [uncultured Maribacter sp.]
MNFFKKIFHSKNQEAKTAKSKVKFSEVFKIEENTSSVSDSLIEEYRFKVPQFLIDLWKADGFGKYNNGLIELVNPKDFEPSLWTWLGQEVEKYVPFAITGFGELFYYRKLTETDEDVCMIDIQYRKVETVVWSLASFFEDFLTNEEDREEWLRETLFKKAIKEKGYLNKNEVFTFTPVLAMGGEMETKYLKKGNAQVYQDIVFQMTM